MSLLRHVFQIQKQIYKTCQDCPDRPGFIYTFQEEDVECYENYLKHKKHFPFTVVGDLETTTGYISEIEGESMFVTSYFLMFNFHPKIEMTPFTCLRSFGQNEKGLKFITLPEKSYPYINDDDIRCFEDVSNTVLEKKKKQAIPIFCMMVMSMVYRCLKSYIYSVVKSENVGLSDEEKSQFHVKADCDSFLKEYSHCYLCKFPLEAKDINSPGTLVHEWSRLDFVIRKEYQFLKNVMTREEITSSNHLCSLEAYYEVLTFIFKAYKFFSRQAKYPVTFDESTLNVECKKINCWIDGWLLNRWSHTQTN